MDNAPWFDAPDLFDQRRIRLADIDGSGVTDILYLGRRGVQVYFNQSGNRWSAPTHLTNVPATDNVKSVTVVDLLGNGTACLVWSSPLSADVRRPMRYLDPMGGQKPHLLVMTKNNLGAETHVQYAPSTRFYLQDKPDGRPWLTRLPFPVHCVEKVTVTDKWRQTVFSSTYSYHHGYFDGFEREFRGFGRVEQLDSESYGEFASGNSASPYITDDKTLYQPPVKTVTWYHTGAPPDRERILSQFEHEYFPRWFEELTPDEKNVLGDFQENVLPEPDLNAEDLSSEEWREALRACKGMMLRQEVYELDVDALEQGEHRPVKLFSTAYHNCHIRRLQAQAINRHAVFLVAESEAITYHYELDLRQDTLRPDPRIAHTLNLQFDEFANILQSVAVVYPRLGQFEDDALKTDELDLIRDVQRKRHLAYTETRYTNDVEEVDNHRLRVPSEILTYELTGIDPEDTDDRTNIEKRYFTLEELRRFRLSLVHQTSGEAVPEIAYHELPKRTTPEKRLVEHVRMLFFKDDLADPAALNKPLPFGQLGRLGLPYETYKLALTDVLLGAVFGPKLDTDARARLSNASISGYLSGADLTGRFAPVPATELSGQYWSRSGIAGFAPDAAQHFFLPERYEDPFGNVTALKYDENDLFVESTTDPMGNKTEVTHFDFRVLQPREMQDINDNLSEVFFDVLGLPTTMAVKGKGSEGDNLTGFTDALANPGLAELTTFFDESDLDEARARVWLGNATARHVYYFGETEEALPDGTSVIRWGQHPACACGILRERHLSQLAPGEESPLQAAFEYSDGMGSVVVKKVQAEPEAPGQPLRWVANGKTIHNNKGKPVKQYEPYFSPPEAGHGFEEPREEGVTPVIYYDAAGRTVRTEMPDGSYSRVEFSPWHVRSFDQNDTVKEAGNAWFARKTAGTATTEEKRAAQLAAEHADTPALTILDSLGREVISITYNRVRDAAGGLKDERYLTFTKLDAEGKPLWIRDARKNLVMQYIAPPVPNNQPADPVTGFAPCYDIAGNLLFQHSMDAGERWMLNDAAGKPMFAWDFNERQDDTGVTIAEQRLFFTGYDALRRPLEQWLTINGGTPQLIERFEYMDTKGNANLVDAKARNLCGQLHKHYDASGLKQVERIDFKGKPEELRRQLATEYKAPVIGWQSGSATAGLDAATFVQITEYDALSRITRLYQWHRLQPDSRVAVYELLYSARGLLESEDIVVRATKTATGYTQRPGAHRTTAIAAVRYNAKGQKERIDYGNRTITRYHYDPETFRLVQLRTTRPSYDPPFPQHRSGLADDRVLQQLLYTYDPVGNITEIHDDAYEPAFFQNQQVEAVNRYTYDALYRLLEATGRESGAALGPPHPIENAPFQVQFPVPDPNALRNYTQHYRYDAVGNIEELRHSTGGNGSWTQHYAYAGDSNRLLRTWHGNNINDAIRYGYDPHGNLLNLANVAPEQSIRWDHRDMIHALDLQGGGWAYYAYDADKQRARKRLERLQTLIEERIDLGGLEIYRKYRDGVLVEEIESVHIFEGERRVLLIDDVLETDNPRLNTGPLFRYQYSNHLGSASLELDDKAIVISYEEYYPYGSTSYQAVNKDIKAAAKRYRYAGKERDEESGLYYHGARYYAPWLGRWTSVDLERTDTSLYVYVSNRPVVLIDSDGKRAEHPHEQPTEQQPKHSTDHPTDQPVGHSDEGHHGGFVTTWSHRLHPAHPWVTALEFAHTMIESELHILKEFARHEKNFEAAAKFLLHHDPGVRFAEHVVKYGGKVLGVLNIGMGFLEAGGGVLEAIESGGHRGKFGILHGSLITVGGGLALAGATTATVVLSSGAGGLLIGRYLDTRFGASSKLELGVWSMAFQLRTGKTPSRARAEADAEAEAAAQEMHRVGEERRQFREELTQLRQAARDYRELRIALTRPAVEMKREAPLHTRPDTPRRKLSEMPPGTVLQFPEGTLVLH